MISQPFTVIRIGKIGKPYVQTSDPSFTRNMQINDIWMNPADGTMKTWDGTQWSPMQFGESSFMDDCVSNRVLANDISASKITAGILRSQDGSFFLNLETGEAALLNLSMGGEVEGNVVATSSNGLTRIRLRGRDGERDVTAGLIFEQRETTGDEWENAGQLYFAYNTRYTYSAMNCYQIGAYSPNRPNSAYNAGSDDGLLVRPISTNWLRANKTTYHGSRLQKRDTTSDSFEDVPPVTNCLGNCLEGTAIVCSGIVTCTYKYNDIMQLDFNLRITTSGSGSSAYGISRNLLRQLNANVPVITPMDGGNLSVYTSSGALVGTYSGATLKANADSWQPAYVNGTALTDIAESALTSGMTLIGTCYGKYDITEI